jgi:hypothetical protein
MALSVQDVTADLRQNFPELFSDPEHAAYLSSYAAIGAFLSGRKAIEPSLRLLETRLENRLLDRLGYDSPMGKMLRDGRKGFWIKEAQKEFDDWQRRLKLSNLGGKPQKDPAFSKLLTTELTEIEQGAGFTLFMDKNGHQKVEMIMPLQADRFRKQIQEGRQFKDPTIGPDHGEYTHRLQWALIVLAGVVTNPVATYKQIGKSAWSVSSGFGLWDALVDRQPFGAQGLPKPFPFYKRNAHDFRTPEALLTWLCEPAQQSSYPLLAGFLKARKAKRAYVTNNDSLADPLIDNYVARKLFGVPFEALSKEDKDDVRLVLDMTQPYGVAQPTQTGKADYRAVKV